MRIQKPSPRETAEQAAQQADAILLELERTPLLLEVLCRLGVVWAKLGKPERAQNAFSAARALLAELPCDDTPEARLDMEYACTLLGTALALAGQVEQARQVVATTPCIERDTVLQRMAARCTSVGSLQEALAIALAIQDATTQGMALESLANEADARRQFALRDQAIARMRNPLRRADALYHIVRRRLERGALAEARALLREATHAVRATRKLPERADWLARLATAQLEAQAPQDALPLLAEAEALLPKLEPYTRARVGCRIVQGYARAGQQARATAAPTARAASQAATGTGARLPASILCRSAHRAGRIYASGTPCPPYPGHTDSRRRLAAPRTRLTGGESPSRSRPNCTPGTRNRPESQPLWLFHCSYIAQLRTVRHARQTADACELVAPAGEPDENTYPIGRAGAVAAGGVVCAAHRIRPRTRAGVSLAGACTSARE